MMKMLVKKLICFIFGHKFPKEMNKNFSFVSVYTPPSKSGLVYSWSVVPCERCCAFQKTEILTEEEYHKIVEESIASYAAALEKVSKELEQKMEDEMVEYAFQTIDKKSKLVH